MLYFCVRLTNFDTDRRLRGELRTGWQTEKMRKIPVTYLGLMEAGWPFGDPTSHKISLEEDIGRSINALDFLKFAVSWRSFAIFVYYSLK